MNTPEEYVVAMPRSELKKHGWDYGVHDFNIELLDDKIFSLVPRSWVDNKSEDAAELGRLMPQVLPYIIARNEEGKILSYRRKGKEEGLLGRWSIGIGGHIDVTDGVAGLVDPNNLHPFVFVDSLRCILQVGCVRELKEEINYEYLDAINYDTIIALDSDKTSSVHVAFVGTLDVPSTVSETCNPLEFFDVEWVTEEELLDRITDEAYEYEPWSVALINNFA